MKLFDKIERWVNKLDTRLFGKNNEMYQPYAGKCFIHVLIASIVTGILVVITQIVTTGKDAEETVGAIAGLIILAIMIRDMRPGLKSITGIGKKTGYVCFNLFLGMIAFQLAMYAIFLLMFLIVGWIIISIIHPDNGKDYTIHYSDGTTENARSTRDIGGNETLLTRNGPIDPNDPEYRG